MSPAKKRSNIISFRKRSAKSGQLDRPQLLDSLYRQHWQYVTDRLRRVFGQGPPEPEDLAQEAFAKFISKPEYHGADYPRALIFRMALNLGFNSTKRMQVAQRFIDDALLENNASVLEEMSPEDVYSVRERLELLLKATDLLTDKQKTVVLRSRIHGETYAEISAATGWSSSDIGRQLQSAMLILMKATDDAET